MKRCRENSSYPYRCWGWPWAGSFTPSPRSPGRRSSAPRPRSNSQGQGKPSTANGEWPTNGADVKFTRYSPLDQINASNFNKLEVAWRFKTDAFGPYPEYKLEGTPIMVKGVLYTTAGTRRSVVALDAKTGELIWSHSLREGERAANSRAPAVGTRGLLLDRRPRRRAHHLRDDRLPPGRAQRQDRGGDPLLRRRRHRRPQGRRREGKQRADRSRARRNRHPCGADRDRGRRDRRLLHARGRDGPDPQQHQGPGARVRRAQRQAAVALQHHSAPGRIRQRDLGEQFLGGERQHRRVGAHHRR